MERNNEYLNKLLKIQAELQSTQARLDEKPEEVAYDPPKQATIGDFFTPDEIRIINKEFSDSLNRKVECDGLDYALACACGVISGLVDVFFVKTPHDGVIGNVSDSLFDKAVVALAGEKNNGEKRSIASAIGFFENKAKVTYDQAKTQEIAKQLTDGFAETIEHLSTKNHHAKSLSHYPDIFGLISSICNQFTNTSSFLDTATLMDRIALWSFRATRSQLRSSADL